VRGFTINGLVVVVSVVSTLAIGEILLRITSPQRDCYHVWPPFLKETVWPSEAVPGVQGPSQFVISSDGLRADELEADHDPVIVALGGSTTECLLLDQREAWPWLVQARLAEARPRTRPWVGNAGRSGRTTREHVVQVPRLLDALPRTDLLMLLIGVNDLGLRLQRDADYDPDYLARDGVEERLIERGFALHPTRPGGGLPFYHRVELYQRLSLLGSKLFEREWHGIAYEEWRAARRSASRIRHELPDMISALEEYRHNVERILEAAQRRNVEVLLLTQPAIWRDDLDEGAKALLWWGGVGKYKKGGEGNEYYSIGAMREGMDLYNLALLRICEQHRLLCLDLASRIPRSTDVFYDDMHLTEYGSRLVAEQVAHYLLESWEPLNEKFRRGASH
jgi:lysophospholipase L1-like esterase